MQIYRAARATPESFHPAHPQTSPDAELLRAALWLLGFGMPTSVLTQESVVSFIRHHGVAGLVDSARVENLDSSLTRALNNERRHIAFRALQLGSTLRIIVSALNGIGLQPLALKGPALAIQAHGSLGARGGVDLDILVDEEQWPCALDALHKLDYIPALDQSLPLPPGTHELVLLHPRWPPVELHRRLLRQRHLLKDPHDRVRQIDLQGMSVATLDPVHALPYLIAHANQHCFRRLIWLMDIHALLLQPGLPMQRLVEQIRLTGTRTMLDTCLTLLERLFGLRPDSPLQSERRPCEGSRRMVEVAMEAIIESLSDDEIAARLGALKRMKLDLAMQDSLGAKWQALKGWLSPTRKDICWLKLPASLSFLYPCVRLYRLMTRAD